MVLLMTWKYYSRLIVLRSCCNLPRFAPRTFSLPFGSLFLVWGLRGIGGRDRKNGKRNPARRDSGLGSETRDHDHLVIAYGHGYKTSPFKGNQTLPMLTYMQEMAFVSNSASALQPSR